MKPYATCSATTSRLALGVAAGLPVLSLYACGSSLTEPVNAAKGSKIRGAIELIGAGVIVNGV